MAWLSRNNIAPTDSLTADMLNSLANDIRYWGGDVNGGGYKLSNVVLSGTGGFERLPTPAVVAAVTPGGNAQLQLTDLVAGTPDTYPPRWSLIKKALPTPDFGIDRYSAGGTFIDEPFMIRASDGVIVMKAQEWTGPINGGGQTITNVVLGPSVIAGAQTPWKQNVNAAKFALHNSRGLYTENVATGVPYSSAGLVIYEALSGGLQTAAESPRIAFYHQGIDASQIGFDTTGSGVRTWTAAGTGYAPFAAGRITAYEAAIFLRDASAGTVTRPSLSGLRGKGEIFGALGDTSDWGFVRISAGGGTASAYRAYIDLSGYNTNPEMDRTIVFGLGGEKIRIDVAKTTISSLELWTPRISQPLNEAHAWNMSYTDVWRYRANGPGYFIYGGADGYLHMQVAVSGTAGASASARDALAIGWGGTYLTADSFELMPATAGGSVGMSFKDSSNAVNFQVGVGVNEWSIFRWLAGAFVDRPFSIDRASGFVVLAKTLVFGGALELKISTHAAGFGIGIEAGTQYYLTDVPGKHRWYCGGADDGVTDKMELSGSKLTINVPTDMKGNLDMGGYAISNFTVGGVAGLVTSFNARTGAVIPAQGDYPPAKLGTGTPDNTKYLRGDGTWQIPPGAGGGEPQSPWNRNIDAAYFQLYNAKNIYTGGTGVNSAYNYAGLIIREANYAGVQASDMAASPRLTFFWSGIDAAQLGMTNSSGTIRTWNAAGDGYVSFQAALGEFASNIATGTVDGVGLMIREYRRLGVQGAAVDRAPRIGFYWSGVSAIQLGMGGGGIRTFDQDGTNYVPLLASKLICPNTVDWKLQTYTDCGIGIEASTQYYRVFASGIHRWYIGTTNMMELGPSRFTSNVDWKFNRNVYMEPSYAFTIGTEFTDAWRYLGSTTAFHISTLSDRVRFLVASLGTAGAAINWVESISIAAASIKAYVPVNVYIGGGSSYLNAEGTNTLALNLNVTDAPVNGRRSRLVAFNTGCVGFETVDDAYTYTISRFHLYTNKVYSSHPLCIQGGATYAPGGQGLHLAFDGASAVVSSLFDAVGWKPLYLRGLNINMEAQGGTLYFAGASSFNSSITQTIPSSQTDPGNFASMTGAHYVYFDPATKKLVLRYHEGGVAYRNYLLKEGDQGPTLFHSAPGGISYSSLSRNALFSTIPITAAGTYTITFSISSQPSTTGSTGTVGMDVWIGARPVAINAGQDIGGTAPVGKQLFTRSGNATGMSRTITLTVIFDGTTYSFSGSWSGFDSGTIAANSFTKEAYAGFTFFAGAGSQNYFHIGSNLVVNKV